jgi:cysteine desulfurase
VPVTDTGTLAHDTFAQALARIDVSVDSLRVDLLSIAGHTCYAPKGAGALYVRDGTSLQPALLGGGQERGLRPGTEDISAIVGRGVARRRLRWSNDRHGRRPAAITRLLLA